MPTAPRKILSIIVAGGSGSRFGSELPKQYCDLEGRPIVMHTIERMRQALDRLGSDSPNHEVVLALHPNYATMWLELCRKHEFDSPRLVFGGDTRWQTVSNSLAATSNVAADIIMVHDAARPLVDCDVVRRLAEAVINGEDGAVPTIAVTDSLRVIEHDRASGEHAATKAVDRSLFRAVQTPQAFNGTLLRKAYALPYSPVMTDDASVMESAGFQRITSVEGNPRTLKITHPADIATVAYYLRNE